MDDRERGVEKTGVRRKRLVLGISFLAACVVAVAVLATVSVLNGGEAGAAAPATASKRAPKVAILPSELETAPLLRVNYRRLFGARETLETAAKPACFRYRRVREAWAKRAEFLRESSEGAGASKAAATRYYASVTWVSQDEAGDYATSLDRISRSRVSAATAGRVKRESVAAAFTRDALEICNLTAAHRRTIARLERLDRRISRIVALARHDGGKGLTDGVAQ